MDEGRKKEKKKKTLEEGVDLILQVPPRRLRHGLASIVLALTGNSGFKTQRFGHDDVAADDNYCKGRMYTIYTIRKSEAQ